MKFSFEKFKTLSLERQHKKILEFIDEIEHCWENASKRIQEIQNFKEFLAFFDDKSINSTSENIHQDINRRDFLKLIVPLEQSLNLYRTDSNIHIQKLDGQRELNTLLDVTLVLSNLRSAFNVGSIMRTAECFGIKNIYLCGYTPDNSKVEKTAMGTRKLLNVTHFDNTEAAIADLRDKKLMIYALETTDNAKSIYDADYNIPAAIILGNEALGIEENILNLADEIIQIPLAGWKNSLNVAVAAAITISEIYKNQN